MEEVRDLPIHTSQIIATLADHWGSDKIWTRELSHGKRVVSPLRYRVPCIIREHVLIFTCLFFSFKVINNDKFSIIGYMTLLTIKKYFKIYFVTCRPYFFFKSFISCLLCKSFSAFVNTTWSERIITTKLYNMKKKVMTTEWLMVKREKNRKIYSYHSMKTWTKDRNSTFRVILLQEKTNN